MTQQPNQLHLQLAQRILTHARLSRLEAGHHLTEQSLQELLGTSRGPIRAALAHLARQKLVEKKPNKGFFLVKAPRNRTSVTALPAAEDEKIYHAIAADRLTRELPDSVTENELMRRYEIPRPRLRRILDRIASEGWGQRRTGHGWSFLPLVDSVEAYQENYELRLLLEVLKLGCIQTGQEHQGRPEGKSARSEFHETLTTSNESGQSGLCVQTPISISTERR